VDFISTHIYPTDPLGFEGANTEEQLAKSPRNLMRDRAKLVRELSRERPVYFTEWNISSNPRDPYHDESFAAAYAAKIALETDPFVDGYSFWAFSDIFEENYFPSIPFHGGFGLLNLQGVPKPVYRAFQLLHGLGNELFPVDGTHDTVDAWVVRNGRSIRVILTNHAQPRHDIVTQLVDVCLTDAPTRLTAYVERIDEDHANPRRRWREMGEPEYPSREQVEQLEVASRLVKEPLGLSYEGGTVRFHVDLPPHSIAAVTLDPALDPSA
jgi:xylan 1,4-beta-xylosidase